MGIFHNNKLTFIILFSLCIIIFHCSNNLPSGLFKNKLKFKPVLQTIQDLQQFMLEISFSALFSKSKQQK